MKNKHLWRFNLISFLVAGLLISSCSKEPEKEVEKEFKFDEIPLNENPIEIEDKSDYYSNHAYDVDPDYALAIGADSSSGLQSPSFPAVSITDTDGNDIEFRTQVHSEDGEQYFMLAPKYGEGYEAGKFYEVTLNDDALYFKDKDPEMDTFYFNVKQEETERRLISSEVKYLDANDLIGGPNFDDSYAPTNPGSIEAANYFRTHVYDFLYKKDVSKVLTAGDLFYVAEKEGNGWKVGFSSFPGEYVNCVYDNAYNAYRVYMKHADLNEVYDDGNELTDDFKVYQKYTPTAFTNLRNEFSEKEVVRGLKNDERFIAQVDAIREALNVDVGISTMDIVSHLSVDFSFSVNAPKVNFQVKVGVLFPVTDESQVKIEFIFQYTIEFRCAAGIKVKRCLGIPYWIDANGDVERITDQKYTVNLIYMYKWKPEEQRDTSSLHAIILTSLWKLEENPSYFSSGGASACKGNTKVFPILSFNIPFSIFNFHIGLDFALTIDFNVMFGYTYTSHSEERIVSFSTNDGMKCTANQVSNKSECHQISFLGQIGLKTGLSLTIDLEVCGLRGVFSVGVKAEIGAYLDIKGGLLVSWGDDQETTALLTASFELGAYAGVVGFLDILIFHPKYEFVTAKWPFLIAGKAESVATMMCPTTYEITTTDPINLDATEITLAKMFSGTDLKFGLRNLRLDKEIELNSGLLEPSHKVKPITLVSDSPYLVVNADNNTIQVTGEEIPPYFEATLTLTVNKEMALSSDTTLVYETKVIYRAENTVTVTFSDINGVRSYSVYEGSSVRMPLQRGDSSMQKGEYRLEGTKYNNYMSLQLGTLYLNMSVNHLTGFMDDHGNAYTEGETITVNNNITLRPMLVDN